MVDYLVDKMVIEWFNKGLTLVNNGMTIYDNGIYALVN